MRARPIDYSKWDHIDDDDEEEEERHAPTVAKLDRGTRVTFGQGQVRFEQNQQNEQKKQQPEERKRQEDQERIKTRLKEIARNGGMERTHSWSQTRDEISIHLFVTKETKAREIKVSVTNEGAGLSQRIKVARLNEVFLDEELAYGVESNEESLLGCYELENIDNERRAVRIDLRKKVPVGAGSGVVIWWRKALKSDKEIDFEAIVDADKSQNALKNREEWKRVWNEAHSAFKDRVANTSTNPVLIDCNEEENTSEQK